MNIVVWPEQPQPWIDAIGKVAGAARIETPANEAEAGAAASSAHAWIGKITPSLFEGAPHLRWLQTMSTSLEHVIFPALAASDVTLTNMRHIYDDHISTHALTMFLSLCRDFPRLMRRQMAGIWTPKEREDTKAVVAAHLRDRANAGVEVRDPADMTVAIVGLGGIGAELGRRLAFLGSTVVGVDPKVDSAPPGVSEVVKPEALPEVLARVDAVIVCAPLTPETTGWFDEAMFRKMRPQALFINVGRGKIVKLAALERALSEGWIAAAALDVFETEPLPADSPLWKMERVLVTPHLAWIGGPRTAARQIDIVLENVRRFVAGEPMINVVDKSRGY